MSPARPRVSPLGCPAGLSAAAMLPQRPHGALPPGVQCVTRRAGPGATLRSGRGIAEFVSSQLEQEKRGQRRWESADLSSRDFGCEHPQPSGFWLGFGSSLVRVL